MTKIADIFNMCEVPKASSDIDSLIDTLDGAFAYMAMVDYPYATTFIANLPAWPVNQACANQNAAMEAQT